MRKLQRILLCVFLPVMAFASTAEDKSLSIERMWQLERIGSPVASKDGQFIVAPVTRFDVKADQGHTRLWLFSADGKKQTPLTAEGLRASEATFSPDGKQLAFVSQRNKDEAGQIYLLSLTNPGEAQRLTEVPTGVYGIKWVGEHLYFITRIWPGKNWDEMAAQLKAEKEKKVSARQWNALPYSQFDHWLDENRQAHVFRIAAKGGEVQAITQPLGIELNRSGQGASSYDIDPQERYIAFNTDSKASDAHKTDPKSDLLLAAIGGDNVTNLSANNTGSDGDPAFSPDGKSLAFGRQRINGFYADNSRVVVYDLAAKTSRELTTNWDRSVNGAIWSSDSRGFYASVDDAATSRLYYIDAKTGKQRAITQETSFGRPALAGKNTLVATNESFLYPAQLVKVDARNGKTTRLDTFNNELLNSTEFGTYESVTYQGADGKDIQMWVHYPAGFDKSKKYPLFLLIHGGPHNAIGNSFSYRWNAQTFASWGYVTAWPNFHGSSGFGQEFADSINPDWRTKPLADIQAATAWFQNQPWIDNDRMVAGGASYGGYLSSILLGTEHPFKALLIHAAVYNMYSQMSADFAVHATRFGNYWDNPEIYKSISPHYYAGNFNTPTLVIHGQLDYRVPVGQGFELFRTLQSRGVESRMIYFPDENHWILKPNNSIYWYNQVKDWMTRFAEPGAK